MSWARGYACGRDVGYSVPCTCEQSGCKKRINRGLAYACGGMHGEDEVSCEKYFCEEHLYYVELKDVGTKQLCAKCRDWAEKQQLVVEEDIDEEVEE